MARPALRIDQKELKKVLSGGIQQVAHPYHQGSLERARYEKERPGAAALLEDSRRRRVIAMVCSDLLEAPWRFPP
jgi:hypothetical protein